MLSAVIKKKRTSKWPGIGFGWAFNPDFDGNALVWYDGDIGLTAGGWLDQGAGGHDLVFANNPTINPVGLNGRQTVTFDGINQQGQVATPAINQAYTLYVVFKQNIWAGGDAIFDDGVNPDDKIFSQQVGSPNLELHCGAPIQTNPDLALGSFGVITCVVNGVGSELRTNMNLAVTGNIGAKNGNGITIGARQNLTFFSDCEFAYLIIRTGADSTATQNKIIQDLMNRFGL